MKVVILCGGMGTRIRDVADNIPKPMIPIGGYPILLHIMKIYATYGHKEFILCLGYKAEIIKDFFLNFQTSTNDFTINFGSGKAEVTFHGENEKMDWRISLVDTGLNSMTGSRIRKIERFIGEDENFLLTYGDGVGDVCIDSLLESHKKSNAVLTITGVKPPGRFGEIECDDRGMVFEFNEKPQTSGGLISGGFFACRRDLFNYLREGDDLVFEQEPILKLVKENKVGLYRHQGFWQPMDTSREYQLLNSIYHDGKAPWVR